MDRRTFQRGLIALGAAAGAGLPFGPAPALATPTRPAPDRPTGESLRHRSLTEYALPEAEQTHEPLKVPGAPLLLVTQWYPSRLLKLALDPRTEQVTGLAQFPLGEDTDLPHGLAASTRYPGRI
ncbi:hypothetical protein J7E96_08755 [Streptomyces sp. ISL-96]|uniref:hypothetical protein n=1 Tax=Streptomyces sp. ISL-96 TaxID=2819191 RepID=UPI001BE81AD8|nr:hypothetical protein [Streptomyces sp. ISL-96]MBT2488612.1 hypothetical protein [Streptomyces sp. ISL-96]